ncbi:MAG: [FeFe] hydrogenase H-cluster maturation GTPase HydF [Proteobacteria bacterium]|nr:[FeFe] hydrogenase H-cluster maturation GTPase HydF [Pseudomonadota bacterium]
MGLNETPLAERVCIGFFGRRNAGKSSLVNAVTGQDLAVVSEVKGTTTDPVQKAMELLPLGPVLIIDTPGFDDEGDLGELRMRKTRQVLGKTDIAVLVVDGLEGLHETDEDLIRLFQQEKIPYLVAFNKSDILPEEPGAGLEGIYVSAVTQKNIGPLKEKIASLARSGTPAPPLVSDLVGASDIAVLVVPIDSAAPKGRLILPQQQVIRDLLEADAIALVVKEHGLREALCKLGGKPRLVITDSQVFAKVSADTPRDVALTSFSILFARYKGLLADAVKGVQVIDRLKDGDTVLISEGCTHHRQCDDIGTVKLPRWLRDYTGRQLDFAFTSGGEFPEDLSPYRLIIHCGGCMLNAREMLSRQKRARLQQVPITNYGIAIAHMQGILKRSLEVFPHISQEFEQDNAY